MAGWLLPLSFVHIMSLLHVRYVVVLVVVADPAILLGITLASAGQLLLLFLALLKLFFCVRSAVKHAHSDPSLGFYILTALRPCFTFMSLFCFFELHSLFSSCCYSLNFFSNFVHMAKRYREFEDRQAVSFRDACNHTFTHKLNAWLSEETRYSLLCLREWMLSCFWHVKDGYLSLQIFMSDS